MPESRTLSAKVVVGSGLTTVAGGLTSKVVETVVPAVLTTISATPAARAARVPAGSAWTLVASAALIDSSVSPCNTRWLKRLTVPARSSARVQVVPATGAPESTTVLVAVDGHGASKVTV